MFKSMRNRLILVFIGLAVGPIILVTLIVAQHNFQVLEAQARLSLGETSRRASQDIQSYIQARQDELSFLIQAERLGSLGPAEQQALLTNLLPYRQMYHEIAMLDTAGKEQFRISSTDVITADKLASRAALPEFIYPSTHNLIYFSPVYFDKASGEPLMTMAFPIVNLRSGLVSQVLIASFRFEEIWNVIGSIRLAGHEDVYVLDQNGLVVAHRDPSIALANRTFVVQQNDGHATGLTGNDVLLATDTIQFGDQQFTVVAEQPIAEALDLASSSLQINIIVTGIALLVALGLGILWVLRFVRPVEQLSSAAQRIRQGDLSTRVSLHRTDEVGILAQSFNEMAQQMQGLIANLESRVRAATRDLELAAQVSKEATTVVDPKKLLPSVVELTRHTFDLAFVAIYVFDESQQLLRLEAATDEAGAAMLAEGRQVELTALHGAVPRAGRERQPTVVNDTLDWPDRYENPHLGDTRAEVALPMLIGSRLIGVLDLQSAQKDRFSDGDMRIMQTLAEQIAIALDNAHMFQQQADLIEQLRSLDQLKSQFLASMSHELRTPLNAILNFTDFVVQGIYGPISDEQADALKKAHSSGKHLLSLINDVLDVAKIQAGMMQLFVENGADLAPEIKTVADTIRPAFNGKDVQFFEDVDASLPKLSVDRRRVRQILLNLLSNAVKFTQKGSVTLSVKGREQDVLMAVIDTGPGIGSADQNLIFEPFKQTDTGLRQGSGTGLGLYISRQLAEAHGGKLWVESEVGQGTAFYLSLPFKKGDTENHTSEKASAA